MDQHEDSDMEQQDSVESPMNEQGDSAMVQQPDEEDSAKSTFDQEDSFRRFEKLLAKTENFSRCLSAGDVTLCKWFANVQLFIWIFQRPRTKSIWADRRRKWIRLIIAIE
jgi:hypothetical protein